MANTEKRDESSDSAAEAKHEQPKKPSFSVDRKGEASAGALSSKDKKRAVPVRRDDGSNTR